MKLASRGVASRVSAALGKISAIGIVASIVSSAIAATGTQSVSLGWDPTTDHAAAGYKVYYGNASGNYSSRSDVGTNLTATVPGLIPGQTNYFVVTAYNAAGVEGPPSSELSYIVPGKLSTKSMGPGGSKKMQLTFAVASGHSYQVQYTSNFVTWSNLWQSGVCTSNAMMTYQDPVTNTVARRFYRLVMH